MDKKELVRLAIEARESSYSPYSNFRVGAALLTSGGKVYQGCNVENASYGAGICAERNAALRAVFEGRSVFRRLRSSAGTATRSRRSGATPSPAASAASSCGNSPCRA